MIGKKVFVYLFTSTFLLLVIDCATVTEQRLAEEYYNLGNAFFELERYDEAINQYNRALTIDRNFSRAEYNLSFSYLALERYQDAQDLLTELLATDPENILLLESKAYADYRSGSVEEAVEQYEAILASDPARTNTLYNLALIQYSNEEYTEAETLLKDAHRLNSQDPLVIYYYILTKYALEQPAEEIYQLAQDILAQTWDDNEKLLQLGILLEELRYFSDATSAYMQIGEAASQYSEALFRIGRLSLVAISEPQQGFQNIEAALEAGFRNNEFFLELYRDERLLQTRQLANLFEQYDIDIELLDEQTPRPEPEVETETEEAQ